jgi:hypothetical protein
MTTAFALLDSIDDRSHRCEVKACTCWQLRGVTSCIL